MKQTSPATEIDRTKPIRDWLYQNNARSITVGKLGASKLELFSVNGQLVLLQAYSGNNGWDVFIPACTANSASQTFAALEAHIGKTEPQSVNAVEPQPPSHSGEEHQHKGNKNR